jgi:hypothetical protein
METPGDSSQIYSGFPILLVKNKKNAVITAFFSEAQFVLRVSGLPLVFILIAASQVDVFLEKSGFYLTLKGFINYNYRRSGASLKKNTVITSLSKNGETPADLTLTIRLIYIRI